MNEEVWLSTLSVQFIISNCKILAASCSRGTCGIHLKISAFEFEVEISETHTHSLPPQQGDDTSQLFTAEG